MDTPSSERREQVTTERVVKCACYRLPMFVGVDVCRACEHHRGIVRVMPAANGMPDIHDVLCALPVHKRVEYMVRKETNDAAAE